MLVKTYNKWKRKLEENNWWHEVLELYGLSAFKYQYFGNLSINDMSEGWLHARKFYWNSYVEH